MHWTLTVARRRTGWLDARAHALWREVWLHTLTRYRLALPIYCLMPDHVHALVVGLAPESDQRLALSFLRRHTSGMFSASEEAEPEAAPLPGASLPPAALRRKREDLGWQKQGYDHVLRTSERRRDGFATVARYIVENPVRAGLADRASMWAYSGSLIAGWPDLDWRREDFWARWWGIYAEE